jgi:tetratricopeptide (TPR) repeat protein
MPRRDGPRAEAGFLSTALRSAAAIGAVLAGVAMVASGLFAWTDMPAPFVWSDVALVQFLCSLPLAAVIAAQLRRRGGPKLCLALGMVCCFAAVGLWAVDSTRTAIALCASSGVVLLVAAMQTPSRSRDSPGENFLAVAPLGLAVMIGLPWVYLEARRSHDDRELAELLDQSRLGEARMLARRLLVLDPNRQFRGQQLFEVVTELDRAVGEIESRIAVPMPPGDADEARLARARDLAILGRTAEALAVLSEGAALVGLPRALTLRGTIHQSRSEWHYSSTAFHRAAAKLDLLPPSPERTASLLEATTGIAFAERKLGHNAAAEAAYQQVLQLDPSADTHYLLAQFYEGTQQAAKAQFHARQAMTIAPERYAQPAQRLIDKLVTHHFGCWGAAAAERSR